jgi:hypothetical protein
MTKRAHLLPMVPMLYVLGAAVVALVIVLLIRM